MMRMAGSPKSTRYLHGATSLGTGSKQQYGYTMFYLHGEIYREQRKGEWPTMSGSFCFLDQDIPVMNKSPTLLINVKKYVKKYHFKLGV